MQEDKSNKRDIELPEPNTGFPHDERPRPVPSRDSGVDKNFDREPGVLNAPDPWRNPWDDDDQNSEPAGP